MARFARQLALSLFLFGFLIVGRSARAQILEIHNDSLTTYKPTGQTAVQLVRPLVSQRGVNVDGSLRSAPGLAMALQGNPFESVWVGKERQDDLRVDIGAYAPFDVDIALPAAGFSWVIGRSYNPLQVNSGASHIDSNGYQGQNWHQMSQPEIILYDDNDNSKDLVYMVYGADRFIEFKRKTESSNQFKATNGAAGCINFVSGGAAADTYVYTDQNGNEITFFGFDGDAGVAAGQLWKMVDPDNNTAFVGHATTSSTAISTGYDAGGRILLAYDSGELHRFTYTYSTLDSVKRLTQVKAETKASGTWASPSGVQMVMQVDYAYYTGESHGDIGDLKQVTITERLSNSTDDGETVDWIKKKYYRYWEGSSDGTSNYNSSTNPGYVHGVKLVVDFEGVRRFDWTDTTFDEDFLSASTDDLKPYAAAYFEYDSSRRVREAWFNGECGCSGAGNGEHEYTYETLSYSSTSGYDSGGAKRTLTEKPDGSYVTQVFDETNQGLSRIVTDIIPSSSDPTPKKWITHVVRDSMGCVTWLHTPANVTGYTHSTNSITTNDDLGLVHKFVRIGSGDMIGFLGDRRWQKGADTDISNPVYFDQTLTWTSTSKAITDVTVVRPLPASDRVYSQTITTSGGTGSYATSYSYTYYSSPAELSVDVRTTTHPTVTTGNNGSNSATLAKHHFRKDGRIDLERTEDDITNFWKWTNGQVAYDVIDANTGHADLTGVTIPSGFATSGTGLHKKTTLTYSAAGKKKKSGTSASNTSESYRSRLADQRLVELDFTEVVAGSPDTYYGPVQFSIVNQAGKVEARGVVALAGNDTTDDPEDHVDETDADPITSMDLGTVAQMTTSIYGESGTQLEESRQYFLIPGSGAGADGTNYDPTVFGYDDSGRRWRTKDASGTIRRTVHDIHGRVTEQWIGTNDNSFSGGESSGPDNMVKTTILVYDGGSDGGNHLLTSRTLRVQDNSTGERVTTYQYDIRGNVLLETTPTAPYALHKYDNMDRRLATGLFSSTASIVVGTDDPTTETANRLGLSQTYFDEKGQVWKTTRHKIDDADGSDDNNTPTLTWFDKVGRAIKVDGPTLEKRFHDRLGRQTQRFILAVDDDSTYAHAVDDVAGDIVLEEHQTRYDGIDDTVLMTASVSRFHNDTDTGSGETEGALDANGDNDTLLITAANLEGRVQITGYWYDSLDRLQDRVEFGTYGGSNFDRDGMSVPSRSDTELRWTTTYNTDGTVQTVEDPKSLVTFWTYDAAGRKTKEVRHYDSGVNSGNPSGTDDNVTIAYAYVDGLRTTLTADLPSGQTDQVTTYTYGTTKGASAGDSKIGTGHLLQKVTYPDSVDSNDVVKFAYNARSQEIWKKDQAGNIIEADYDTRGRHTHTRITTLAGGFDGAVRRISKTYDGLGRAQLVTQYDNATVGSGSVTDEVKYTWSDWNHMLEKFEQDRNSAVGGGSDDYEVSYTFAAGGGGGGRNTVKRASMFLPSGKEISYKYRFSDGKHDLECSRATAVYDDTVGLAHYEYNGVGQLVGTDLYEADVMWNMFSSTSGDYPDLDRFNRVVKSKWTKDLSTDKDFYSVTLTYDRNSNITSADDAVHSGFDVKYTMDDVDRLVQAEEGTLSSGSITSKKRDQQWTLTHVGNWDYDKVDLNGDGDFVDTDEVNDHRTHNAVNELTGRDTDNNASDNYTLAYDAVGNLTDDGKDYEYEYDAFGRLRKVKKTTDQSLVAEYRYNGLGFRIAVHGDTDTDGDVDSNDKWYYDAFDDRWRVVARFRESDSSPKEEFVHHAAGNDGLGGSSYVDAVICRYKDANTSWTAASDGVLEERLYYCQNWRADVSCVVTSTGQMKEWVKYSAYGVPFGLPGGDTDSDGDCDSTDIAQVQNWIDAPSYDVRGDIDLDGDVDATDKSILQSAYSGTSLGRGSASAGSVRAGRSYAGVAYADFNAMAYSVRYRHFAASLGLWISRDPSEATGGGLYTYASDSPLTNRDPLGLWPCGISFVGPPIPWSDRITVTRKSSDQDKHKADAKKAAEAAIGALAMAQFSCDQCAGGSPCSKTVQLIPGKLKCSPGNTYSGSIGGVGPLETHWQPEGPFFCNSHSLHLCWKSEWNCSYSAQTNNTCNTCPDTLPPPGPGGPGASPPGQAPSPGPPSVPTGGQGGGGIPTGGFVFPDGPSEKEPEEDPPGDPPIIPVRTGEPDFWGGAGHH